MSDWTEERARAIYDQLDSAEYHPWDTVLSGWARRAFAQFAALVESSIPPSPPTPNDAGPALRQSVHAARCRLIDAQRHTNIGRTAPILSEVNTMIAEAVWAFDTAVLASPSSPTSDPPERLTARVLLVDRLAALVDGPWRMFVLAADVRDALAAYERESAARASDGAGEGEQ